jgi:hypothetical protein
MPDEHEQQGHQREQELHQQEQEQAQDSTPAYFGAAWWEDMTPEERERQAERRVPKSEVIVTWVILIGVAALVVVGVGLTLFAH